MKENKITFLSSRGSGLNSDLKMVESYLASYGKEDNYAFRFFLRSERIVNAVAKQGISRAKRQFCEDATNVICTDISLGKDVKELGERGSRILIGTPYEYQFKNALLLKNKKSKGKWRSMGNYTHIIPGSPFSEKLIKDGYVLENTEMIKDVCLPFVWELNQKENREKKRKELEFYFPSIKNKKVLAIMVYGDDEEKDNSITNFDITKFVKSLGEDWFVLTNLEPMLEMAYALNSQYRDSFGYVNRMLPAQDVLYIADALVTNNGRFAGYFSSLKKSIYCMSYKENHFENFMKECYPEMFMGSFGDLMHCDFEKDNLKEAQVRFQNEFSYSELKCPYEIIRKLVNENK